MKNLFFVIVVLFGTQLRGQLDFTHLSLNVRFDTADARVEGSVCHTFTGGSPGDSVFLNGIRMDYRKVNLNGKDIEYKFDESGIWFFLDNSNKGETNRLCIDYSCQPRKGIYFIGWDDEENIAPRQIWTQGQGTDHRHWIPHRDDQTDKVITDISISFDRDYEVMSNGELNYRKADSLQPGNDIWNYSMNKPMSSYLISLVIGEYDIRKTQSQSGISLSQYYYPDRKDDYQYYYYKNEEIFNFLEEEIGIPYPWSNYKQAPVQDFRHGAMENTTATIFGDFFLVDEIAFNDRNYTYVNAHELAHQWFGNLVTATDADHHWLHEGFATYYQWLSEKNIYGEDYFDWMRYEEAELVFQASLMDSVPLGNGKAGSQRFYQKGAWVLYMLNEGLGRDDFREVVKSYLQKYAYGLVTTDSLRKVTEEVTGKDHKNFFNYWVKSVGEPAVEVRQNKLTDQELGLWITMEGNTPGDYEIPFPVELIYKNGEAEIKVIYLKVTSQIVSLSLKGELAYWNFNPDFQVLCHEEEDKPYEIWKAQLKDENVLDRREAVMQIGKFENEDNRELFEDLLENEEEFHAVRYEALHQLLEMGEESDKYLETALNSDDVQLQKKAIQWVDNPSGSLAKALENVRSGQSYNLREAAVHKSIDMKNAGENRWLDDDMYVKYPGIPGHKVEITALMYRVPLFRDGEALQKLISYSSPSYDFLTRTNAIVSIAALNYVSEEVIDNLMNALFNTNWHLRGEAAKLLKTFYKDKKGKKIIDKHVRKNKGGWKDFQIRRVNSTFDLNIN